MKKFIKYILLSICSILCLFVGVACGGGTEEETYTGFLEGYKKSVKVGDSLTLNEYVDYINDVEYTLIAKHGETTVNLTKRKVWNTSDPGLIGEWKLIYTIAEGDYAGEYVGTIQITVPKLAFSFVITDEAITYAPGGTMDFKDFFTAINLVEDSYFPCTVTMRSVLFNGEETDLTNVTEYTFTNRGTYYFTFTVASEDGQQKSAIINVHVIDMNTAPFIAYKGLWTGDTKVERVELVPGDYAVKVTKLDNQAYFIIGLDDVWLADAFADERTISVSFKVYADYAKYRTGGGYNNSFYKNNSGDLIRTSWTWCSSAVTKTDDCFNLTLSKAEYEKWLEAKGSANSDMYLSIGFLTESGGAVATKGESFHIEDIVVVDKAAHPFYGFVGKTAADTKVNTTAKLVERTPGESVAQVIKSDDLLYNVVGLDAAWLAEAFANDDVIGVSFKVYSEHPIYRTGGGFNNSFVKDTSGKLQRTSWAFSAASTKTDGYFLLTVTRTEYEKWLSCLENGTDVEGKEISADAQSPMYFSIGFYGEDNAMVAADNFYIEDLAIKKTDKSLAPIVGFKGKSNGNTNVTTAVQVVERLADDFAAQIIKTDDQAYSVFGLDASWLADAFADTNTTGVSFKIYSAHPIYRTGGGYNNTFVKDTAGKLQRTSWNFAGAAPTKTDGYFLFTVTRAEYEKWLNCVTNSKDVGGTAISVDAQSAMYFSVGFYGEGNAFVQPDNFYIDDLVVVKAEA